MVLGQSVGVVGAGGRCRDGIIHGAPADSRAGCCGNQCCALGRTASRRLRPEQEGEVGEGGRGLGICVRQQSSTW